MTTGDRIGETVDDLAPSSAGPSVPAAPARGGARAATAADPRVEDAPTKTPAKARTRRSSSANAGSTRSRAGNGNGSSNGASGTSRRAQSRAKAAPSSDATSDIVVGSLGSNGTTHDDDALATTAPVLFDGDLDDHREPASPPPTMPIPVVTPTALQPPTMEATGVVTAAPLDRAVPTIVPATPDAEPAVAFLDRGDDPGPRPPGLAAVVPVTRRAFEGLVDDGEVVPPRPLAPPVLWRRRPRVRRVTRVVRHVDPWSIFKIAVVFNVVIYGVCLTAGVLLWNVAQSTGTIDNIERFLESGGWETFEFKGGEIYHHLWIAGLFAAAGLTGLAVLIATLFNLITDLVGGVRVTVLEEEVVVSERVRRRFRASKYSEVQQPTEHKTKGPKAPKEKKVKSAVPAIPEPVDEGPVVDGSPITG